MISWSASKIIPLSVEVRAGNESFEERLHPIELPDTTFSTFLLKLSDFNKLVFNLRPEFQWVEFKVNGYTLRTTVTDMVEQDNKEEPYDDGYPTF